MAETLPADYYHFLVIAGQDDEFAPTVISAMRNNQLLNDKCRGDSLEIAPVEEALFREHQLEGIEESLHVTPALLVLINEHFFADKVANETYFMALEKVLSSSDVIAVPVYTPNKSEVVNKLKHLGKKLPLYISNKCSMNFGQDGSRFCQDLHKRIMSKRKYRDLETNIINKLSMEERNAKQHSQTVNLHTDIKMETQSTNHALQVKELQTALEFQRDLGKAVRGHSSPRMEVYPVTTTAVQLLTPSPTELNTMEESGRFVSLGRNERENVRITPESVIPAQDNQTAADDVPSEYPCGGTTSGRFTTNDRHRMESLGVSPVSCSVSRVGEDTQAPVTGVAAGMTDSETVTTPRLQEPVNISPSCLVGTAQEAVEGTILQTYPKYIPPPNQPTEQSCEFESSERLIHPNVDQAMEHLTLHDTDRTAETPSNDPNDEVVSHDNIATDILSMGDICDAQPNVLYRAPSNIKKVDTKPQKNSMSVSGLGYVTATAASFPPVQPNEADNIYVPNNK